jgi:hypothetical protein
MVCIRGCIGNILVSGFTIKGLRDGIFIVTSGFEILLCQSILMALFSYGRGEMWDGGGDMLLAPLVLPLDDSPLNQPESLPLLGKESLFFPLFSIQLDIFPMKLLALGHFWILSSSSSSNKWNLG